MGREFVAMCNEFEVDLEKGRVDCEEESRNSPEKLLIPFLGRVEEDKPLKTREENIITSVKTSSPVCETDKSGSGRSGKKEKRKTSASKPPRPPRGPSLDAADQKLIKEIADLAMLKRAKIERMRALKKMKASKSSSAASSLGNVLATAFTVIFCFVILFEGMSSNLPSGSFGKSPSSRDSVSVQYVGNPSTSKANRAYTKPVIMHTGLSNRGVSRLPRGKVSLRLVRKD